MLLFACVVVRITALRLKRFANETVEVVAAGLQDPELFEVTFITFLRLGAVGRVPTYRHYRTSSIPKRRKQRLDRGCGQHFPRVGRYDARWITSGRAVNQEPCFSGGLFHNPLPDQVDLNDGRGEFRGIDPQGHTIRPLERKPSLASPADNVGDFVDLHVMDYKSLFRMNLDGGAVSAKARDPRQSLFRCRRGF